ncbi:aminopeptidase 2 [Xylogone sp. PMI_703]|nr:aminopeptidase 2 [Xylogone sp. PMI_703]
MSNQREVLPKSLVPIHYDLSFEPDLEEAKHFDGTVTIEINVVEETSSIVINAVDLEILETEINQNGSGIEHTDITFDKKLERMIVSLRNPAIPGSPLFLKQKFKGSLLHPNGLFRSPVEGADVKSKWMVSTHMEPTGARMVFPSFDEPALKATFTVTLIAEPDLTCLGNMDVAATTEILSGSIKKKAVTFNKTPPMSTYIVAFAVGDFNFIETNTFHVPVRVYALAGRNIEHGRTNVEHASRTLKRFEEIFGLPFPLPKIDLLATPGSMGAMENWGLVIFGESLLLVDEKATSAEAFRQSASVVVHELAHQWFGNLVTMDFWDGLWLNESFADWAELHAWETLNPSWQMWQNYTVNGYQLGLTLDSNRASHPVEAPVNRTTEINQIFDAISYNKGCAVIRMISEIIGIENFLKGVRLYLKRHTYGNTTTKDLWDALSEVSKRDVGALMENWTRKVGYPVLSVVEEGEKIFMKQNRFLQDGLPKPEEDETIYSVPLHLKWKHGPGEDTILVDRKTEFKASEGFIKLNSNQTAFYRVSYTPEQLHTLAQQAKERLLSETDRIGIISDSLAVASSGISNLKTHAVLGLLESFQEENNFFVWKQIFTTLQTIIDAWTFEDAEVVNALSVFKKRLTERILKKTGWEYNDRDSNTEQMFKALVFANSRNHRAVRDAALEMFNGFKNGQKDAININLRYAVFATVLEDGTEEQYETILESTGHFTTLDERDAAFRALGASQSPHLIARTLDLAVSQEAQQRRLTQKILKSLTGHRPGKEALWSWLKSDWERLKRIFRGGIKSSAKIVHPIVLALGTKEQYDDVKAFFEGKDTSDFNSYLAQGLNALLAKIRWVERDRDDVKAWLESHGYFE